MIDLTFIAERYNYWIFIVLMMIGLYTVISRGNLIKKIVGLNIFQTSVFIYYISMGKIAGGTAPIIVGGEGGDAEHGAGVAGEAAHADVAPAIPESPAQAGGEALHAAPSEAVEGLAANDLSAAVESAGPGPIAGGESLHTAPTANPPLAETGDGLLTVPPPPSQAAPTFEIAPPVDAAHHTAVANPFEALHPAAEIIYTNPLPHVLILTAIVVGVATTAVGLALAVRIREAYGSIEEDELEAADDIAEFGRPMSEGAAAR